MSGDIQPDTPFKEDQCGIKPVLPAKSEGPRASGHSEGDVEHAQARALLPKNTVVCITGNARTNPALVGQQGITRRAMGLGGWHWLELPDGSEVKLQRNALTVIQLPEVEEESSESEVIVTPVPVAPIALPLGVSSVPSSRQSLRRGQPTIDAISIPSPPQRCDGVAAGVRICAWSVWF
jgi:hypothetical protein